MDLGAGYTRRSEVPELAIFAPTGNPLEPVERLVVFPNIQDNWRLRAGLALPLFTGGRIGGQIEATKQGRSAAGEDLRAGRADLVFETKSAYWSLVTARESQRVLQETIRAYDAHLEDARNRERFGLAARNEVLAVQVERDRVELERLRAEAAADAAEANLHRLLDLPPAARVLPAEPLETSAVPRPDVEALVAEAQAGRAERKALASRVAAAEAVTGAERGARLPQVALAGGYTYANPNRDIVPPTTDWKDTWDVGVGLSWNVFDGGRALRERGARPCPGRRDPGAASRARPGDPPRGHAARPRAAHRRGAARRRRAERRVGRREPPGGRRPLPRGRHPLLRAPRRRGRARAGRPRAHRGPRGAAAGRGRPRPGGRTREGQGDARRRRAPRASASTSGPSWPWTGSRSP